jgi:quinol monooxygenase YgiN
VNSKTVRAFTIEATQRTLVCESVSYNMYASEQQGWFFAIEIWGSRQALDEDEQTAHFKAAAARFAELLQGTLAVDILDAIE